MKKILIPTDFSENSKNALRYAVDLHHDTPCHFYLLHVNVDGSEYMEKPIYNFGTGILVEKEPKAIDQKLKDLKKSLESISHAENLHRFTTISEEGSFLKSIRKHIKENKIALIVMGTKGASELKEFLMGSNTGDVITKVKCDVLVIPDKAEYNGFNEVIFSTDFAQIYSDDILKGITGMVSSKTAQIHVVHVTKSGKSLSPSKQTYKEDLRQRLTVSLPNPINFRILDEKNVKNAVLDFAEGVSADLIIMVSKDYGFLNKLFLDTTVEEVSFDTRIPLLSLQD